MVTISIKSEFYQEIRNKKKIGVGIFKRKGTIKGGGNQPLKTPYFFMSKKERDALNSEEITLKYTLDEVMKYEAYEALPPSAKKEVLTSWVSDFSLDYIAIKMNVEIQKLKEELEHYNVEVKKKVGSYGKKKLNGKKEITYEEAYEIVMNHENMNTDDFLDLKIDSQLIILNFLQIKHRKIQIINQFLGLPKNLYVSKLKQRAKYEEIRVKCREYHKNIMSSKTKENTNDTEGNNEMEITEEKAIESVTPIDESPTHHEATIIDEVPATKKPITTPNENIETDIKIETTDYALKIQGNYDKDFLSKKLKNIRREIKETMPNKLYKITVTIEEVK